MLDNNKTKPIWNSFDTKNKPKFLESRSKEIIIASCGCGLLGLGLILFSLPKLAQSTQNQSNQEEVVAPVKAVTALGRIEPQGEVTKIAATTDLGGTKILEIYVKEGDIVTQNQLLAVLDKYPLQKATLEVANKEIQLQKSNLDIVKAGAKIGEINSQKATIERLEAELNVERNRNQAEIAKWQAELEGEKQALTATVQRLQAESDNASIEFQRYESLAKDGAISLSELDQRRLTLDTTREQLEEAQANLSKTIATIEQTIKEAQATSQKEVESLTMQIKEAEATLAEIVEVRPVDVQEAQAKLDKAIAESNRVQQELALSEIRAPIAGRILKIHSNPGETISEDDGFIELGKTDQMMVIAEVHESDISKVKLGQQVIITSEGGAFSGELKGTVDSIGWQIGKNDVLDSDPAADVDKRVVEVKILLDSEGSQQVQNFTYSQVFVKILL